MKSETEVPFDLEKMDRPIFIVEDSKGFLHIQEGNHRIYSAKIDKIDHVPAYVYTPTSGNWQLGINLTLRVTCRSQNSLASKIAFAALGYRAQGESGMAWNEVSVMLLPPRWGISWCPSDSLQASTGEPVMILKTELVEPNYDQLRSSEVIETLLNGSSGKRANFCIAIHPQRSCPSLTFLS